MPVPKGKRRKFGLIVGRMINLGKSPRQAKRIADRAIRSRRRR